MTSSGEFADWIGRTEILHDFIAPAPAEAASATFDDPLARFPDGSGLPPAWHWFHFLPKVPTSRIGADGHPRQGGFLPPIPLPRRMFAGARLRFLSPLRVGRPAVREGVIRDVSQKAGRTGLLAFVTVAYTIRQDGRVCVQEEQDIVYREHGVPLPAPEALPEPPPVPEGAWVRVVHPDPMLLFRFSALTFNAHRIHYDRPYAIATEGYPGLVVHGPLTAALLLELVRSRAPDRRIAGFAFRGEAPLFDLAPFRLLGVPQDESVTLTAEGPDGRTAMSATVTFG